MSVVTKNCFTMEADRIILFRTFVLDICHFANIIVTVIASLVKSSFLWKSLDRDYILIHSCVHGTHIRKVPPAQKPVERNT